MPIYNISRSDSINASDTEHVSFLESNFGHMELLGNEREYAKQVEGEDTTLRK